METALHYDPSQKQLSFLLKEGITTDPDVQLCFRGKLNTVTGSFDYHATAQKFFSSGPAIKESLTQPLRLGVGIGVSSSHSDEPFLAATASKKISLLEGEHTQLSAKARLELDPPLIKDGSHRLAPCVAAAARLHGPPGPAAGSRTGPGLASCSKDGSGRRQQQQQAQSGPAHCAPGEQLGHPLPAGAVVADV